MNKTRRIVIIIFFTTLLASAQSVYKKYSVNAQEKSLKLKLLSAVQKIDDSHGKSLSLKDILPIRYSDLCFQPAYMLKQDFEEKSLRVVENYRILQQDGEIMWWLFEENGQGTSIEISNVEIALSPDTEFAKCFSIKNSVASFDREPYQKTLKVEEVK